MRDDVLVSSKLLEMTLDMQSSSFLLRLGIGFLAPQYYFYLCYVPTCLSSPSSIVIFMCDEETFLI